MTPVFHGQWNSKEDLIKDFFDNPEYKWKDQFPYNGELDDIEILFASYTYECYEGDAFVLFRKDGKLFEVNGGHCSCYGLEGQWDPEETTKEVLLHRINEGNFGKHYSGQNTFANELIEVLKNV
jgi:hypothetical protein